MVNQTWIKPSGIEIELNDRPATVAHARSLGWKPKDEPKGEPKANKKPKADK